MTILFVSGVSDLSEVGLILDEQGKLGYMLDGNCSVENRLPMSKEAADSCLLFGKAVEQQGIGFTRPPSLIFNQIANPDTHRGALERCIELCEQVNTTVINHPGKVLQTSRDLVAQKLQGIPGVIVPRTQRFQPRSPDEVFSRAAAENFDFPFIARVAGLHGGVGMVRVDNRDSHALLHALPFDGRDFYLTEFVDYGDEEGMYHKQRIVCIDGEPFLLNSVFGPDWNIHASARSFMLQRESWEDDRIRVGDLESRALPPLLEAIRGISQRLGLEYFGIDCSLRPDGQMLVFEANANMNLLHNPHPELQERFDKLNELVYQLLTKYSGEKVI
jgi:glutathione synthase/RimK-type ligase-like ATP-grasp enzyme